MTGSHPPPGDLGSDRGIAAGGRPEVSTVPRANHLQAASRRANAVAARRGAPAWRRLAAFGVDYVAIAAYIGLLTAVGFGVRAAFSLDVGMPATLRGRLLGHLIGLLTLTLPVTLYFALFEGSARQATPGKRALGLCVTTLTEEPMSRGRALARTAVKFAPWELAHTALRHTPGWPLRPEPTLLHGAAYAGSLLLAGWYVASLFLGDRRTPYDRVAGTRVVRT
jgi:uncharacterized RDD family membrane protein YckC